MLSRHGAHYRFGAPLDVRWMSGGWSAHLEYREHGLRIRTDFFTRPPHISPDALARIWHEQEGRDPPFVDAVTLAAMKRTAREKDYAVIGELARIMPDPRDRLLHSRSARDLLELVREHPALAADLAARRPLLALASSGRAALEEAIDRERRELMHANERRLARYREASERWFRAWKDLERETEALPLATVHARLVERATALLPERVEDAP